MSRQPADHYLNLKDRHPKLIGAVEALKDAARSSGPLDEKTIHLVQLAAAAAIHSHGSVRSHATRALEAGATPEELRAALAQAVDEPAAEAIGVEHAVQVRAPSPQIVARHAHHCAAVADQ